MAEDRARFRRLKPFDYPDRNVSVRGFGEAAGAAVRTVDQSARDASRMVMAPFNAGASAINRGIEQVGGAASDFASGFSQGVRPGGTPAPAPAPVRSQASDVSGLALTQAVPDRGFTPDVAPAPEPQNVEVMRGTQRDTQLFPAPQPVDLGRLPLEEAVVLSGGDLTDEQKFFTQGVDGRISPRQAPQYTNPESPNFIDGYRSQAAADVEAYWRNRSGRGFPSVEGNPDVYYGGSSGGEGKFYNRNFRGMVFSSPEEAAAGKSFASQVKEQTIQKLASAAGLNFAQAGLTEVKAETLPQQIAAQANLQNAQAMQARRGPEPQQAEVGGFDPFKITIPGPADAAGQPTSIDRSVFPTPEGRLVPAEQLIQQPQPGTQAHAQTRYRRAIQSGELDPDISFTDYWREYLGLYPEAGQ